MADRSEDLDVQGADVFDLSVLWVTARRRLEQQLKVIEDAMVAGIEGRLDPERQREAAREAHKLAGSLGTFGSDAGSRLARALEIGLTSTDLINPAQALDMSGFVLDLQLVMSRPITPPASRPADDHGGAATLLVVDADVDRARRVVEAAAGLAMRASFAGTTEEARQLISTSPPHAVVIAADVADVDEVVSLLAEVARHEPVIVTVVLVSHAGVSERVRAAQVGAQVVLELPMPPDEIVHVVSRLLKRIRATSTVLILDDDPTFRVLVREVLGAQGLVVKSIGESGGLWAALEAVEPDLLLLDNDMPDVGGISLCLALRSDERWARLPVVFLSGSRSPEVVREMFAAGADDFVPKPISFDDLVNRVVHRIQRSRAQTDRPGIDLVTGLPVATALVRAATRLLGLAARDRRPAVFALVEIDPFGERALAALGQVLRRRANPEDAVGAWPGGRVAALLYGVTGSEAEDRLAQVLRAAATPEGANTSRTLVGLASFSDDGSDIWALSAAAETALGRARQAPGDAIERHQPSAPGRAEVVDVLFVDDDEALASLVIHALSGRGWSVRWLLDGAEAVELLDDPAFRARTILLDVGLPGLDGLSVLRHLAETSMLATTPVVMLTVRSNEREVVEAFDLGAFDHVAKPFSLSVLLHRVRRALDASA